MRRPNFIAKQARHARGPLGRIIAFIMARETWAQNRRAMAGALTDVGLDVDAVSEVGGCMLLSARRRRSAA
jgi:hypothetical protein